KSAFRGDGSALWAVTSVVPATRLLSPWGQGSYTGRRRHCRSAPLCAITAVERPKTAAIALGAGLPQGAVARRGAARRKPIPHNGLRQNRAAKTAPACVKSLLRVHNSRCDMQPWHVSSRQNFPNNTKPITEPVMKRRAE